MGITTYHVTGAKQGSYTEGKQIVDDLEFYRTKPGLFSGAPILNQYDVVEGLKRRIREIIHEVRPDIVHAHSPVLNGLAAASVAKQEHIPFVYEVRAFWEDAAVDHKTTHEQSLRYRITRQLETHVFKKADAVTCICEGLRQDIVGRGVNSSKITVIGNAVNPEKFEFRKPKDALLLEQHDLSDAKVLGFIGSFYAYEGLDLILDALPEVVLTHPDFRLLLVGGGSEESSLREKIRALGLEPYVIMTGRVPHDEVSRYYSLVDIFVYPRKKMRLTDLVTPLKPLEAMASGKLVVASDVGGHKELIRDRENGFLFPSGNPEALAEIIIKLFDKQETWQSIIEAGRRYVESERTWEQTTKPYADLYSKLLDK
jgi:PEP-CTERM/exosortase A-associated glycosyltransferase